MDYGPTAVVQSNPGMQKWYDQQHHSGTEELRSVTPAMNNTRGSFRSSPAASNGPNGSYPANTTPTGADYGSAGAPSRYLGAYNSPDAAGGNGSVGPSNGDGGGGPHQPSSTGLIRLSLRKPMGIVFEPMYDPNNASLQRGVRICDLPRTGAAALSRKLEVGDELLSINDKTMSRLSFDEIMDFIIEADPEEVNLLFRRPRKETLQARQGIKKSSGSQPAVKWVDDDVRNKKKDKKKDRKEKKSRRSKKEEDDTITSQDEDYRGRNDRGSSRKKGGGRGRKHPYESESFLDLLIDTICANPDHACRERRRGGDDDYYSDEDEDGTYASQDDSTYVTYESDDRGKRRGKSKKREDSSVEETEDDTIEEKWKQRRHKEKKESRSNKSPVKEKQRPKSPEKLKTNDKYEDDGTLETVDSQERAKAAGLLPEQPPLGMAPPEPEPVVIAVMPPPIADEVHPAPIKELEYDDRIDHGADVSVMESLGGPSLLIEKQRMAMAAKVPAPGVASGPMVPVEFIEKFGKDYPVTFGLTHEQTIQADPLKFYTFVVKGLLEEHEPEKVRLLDKLLAKYKGREDHLVQKLSVRYSKTDEPEPTASIPEEEEGQHEEEEPPQPSYVEPEPPTPKERSPSPPMQSPPSPPPQMHHSPEPQFTPDEWPDKETKEAEEGDSQEEASQSGESEYSGDSIDGTSPAVIAQVSELLNYVYGKTSVPGQIDRVSTIMRAYEGREAVLLELLETKALIKANKEKENADNLPSFLRNSQAMQFKNNEDVNNTDMPPVTPMATQQHVGSGGTLINDDISSMSGVSSPAEGGQQLHAQMLNPPMSHEEEVEVSQASHHEMSHSMDQDMEAPQHKQKNRIGGTPDKKKKKGIFGGLFGGKKNKKNKDSVGALPANDSLRSGSRSRASRKLKSARSSELSI